jgi:hypothetical protein
MAKKSRQSKRNTGKWIIVLVAFDDDCVPAQVIKERIPHKADEHLAAFLRGGDLVTTLLDDNSDDAELLRLEVEKQCLR